MLSPKTIPKVSIRATCTGTEEEKVLMSRPVDELVVIRILYQLLLALDVVHSKMIVHKDVKSESILLDS